MLTGHAAVETATEGMKLGAFDYLKKPTELEDLPAKADEALKKKEEHQRKIRDAAVREAVTTHGV
jgi:DNA-binding NtrC family response regulator